MSKPEPALYRAYMRALADEASLREQVADALAALAGDLELRGQPGFAAAFRDMGLAHRVKALEARGKAASSDVSLDDSGDSIYANFKAASPRRTAT